MITVLENTLGLSVPSSSLKSGSGFRGLLCGPLVSSSFRLVSGFISDSFHLFPGVSTDPKDVEICQRYRRLVPFIEDYFSMCPVPETTEFIVDAGANVAIVYLD